MTIEENDIRELKADVLVIGGGGAGVMAAIAARKEGSTVLLASKGKIGNSGDTIMIGGSYSMDGRSARKDYGFRKADPSFTKEFLFDQIVKQSFYLSEQPLVRQFVEESPPLVYACHQWGEKAGQRQRFVRPGGWILSGHSMGAALLEGLKETGDIQTLEDFMVVDLLRDDAAVRGAVGFSIHTGEYTLIRAKAVVIATGGYQPFSVTSTNSDVVSGDGLAMAYRAGAQLGDMEFLLFIPTVLDPRNSRGSILPYLLYAIGLPIATRDASGETIDVPSALKKIAKGSELGKVIWNYYWSMRLAEGKDSPQGGLYMDFTHLTRLPRFVFNLGFKAMLNYFKQFYPYGHYHSDDLFEFRDIILNQKRLEFGLCSEYSMGGIVVDAAMSTCVSGLFAAGEATSGLFGACRVADATTEMLVQGNRAGLSAAAFASRADEEAVDEAKARAIIDKTDAPCVRDNGPSPLDVVKRIHGLADSGFGSYRTEGGLTAALEGVLRIGNEVVPKMAAKSKSRRYNYEKLCAVQADNLQVCLEAGLRAALRRRESRGFHVRADYPRVDNGRWAVRILEKATPSGMALAEKAPETAGLAIPAGSEANIAEYIVRQRLYFKNIS